MTRDLETKQKELPLKDALQLAAASEDPLDMFMEDIDRNATKQEIYDEFANPRDSDDHNQLNESQTNGGPSALSFSFGGNQL